MTSRIGKILTATAVTAVTAIMSAASFSACLRVISAKEDDRGNETVIEDLNTYSSSSRLQRYRYERFADRASADGNRTAAGLFSALARSERIHENACTRAAGLLKGECRTIQPAAFEIQDTKGNLRRSLDDERSRLGSSRGDAVARAIETHNDYTARILIWIAGTNRRHIELLERCIDRTERDEECDGCEYAVCPVCGNIYEAENYDAYCPLCRTHHSEFESFGRLQVYKTVTNSVND